MRTHPLALAASVAGLAITALPAGARVPHPQFAPGVLQAWWLAKAAPTYRADHRIEVRADPEPDSPVTMILRRGEVFEAAAQTEDGWVAVAQDGVVRGYVFHGLVSALDYPSDAGAG
jgi:hypothetical protein